MARTLCDECEKKSPSACSCWRLSNILHESGALVTKGEVYDWLLRKVGDPNVIALFEADFQYPMIEEGS
jgi:hypothetical protein